MSVALDVLVLAAFDDIESVPAETAPWHDRYTLNRSITLSGLTSPIEHDGRLGVTVTGIGKAAAATTVSALCASNRVDLSRALVLSVGVAGGSPDETSIGSVVLASTIVDWDLKLRWDDRPSRDRPPFEPNPYTTDDAVVTLNPSLVSTANRIAETVDLPRGTNGCTPAVSIGTNLCGDEVWHGERLADNARWLVDRYDASPYLVSEMEDIATAHALHRFGLIDRYLSIRSVANYDRPGGEARTIDFEAAFEAGAPVAIENAVAVASAIATAHLERDLI